jgi:hypothetical protein
LIATEKPEHVSVFQVFGFQSLYTGENKVARLRRGRLVAHLTGAINVATPEKCG